MWDTRNLKLRSLARSIGFQYIMKLGLLLYSAKWLFQIVFIDIVWKTNYFKISNWNISKKQRQNLIKLAPYLDYILLYKEKVIESFSFGVYSRILINKIDNIDLTLTMFVGYQKFITAFPGLFNSFPIHSEAWVTAVFRQVIVSYSFHWYRLKNKLFQNFKLKFASWHNWVTFKQL